MLYRIIDDRTERVIFDGYDKDKVLAEWMKLNRKSGPYFRFQEVSA